MLTRHLRNAGIAFSVKIPDGAFWRAQDDCAGDGHEHVVDSTFVDDEAIVLLAKTPEKLDETIHVTLEALFRIFGLLHLDINLAAGKTECFLTYRGKDAIRHREARRQADGHLRVQVPHRNDLAINVVASYKHLVTFCSAPVSAGATTRTVSSQH